MKIIDAGYEILPRDEERGGLRAIELAARTCYKSEDKITEGSAEGIVQRLIEKGHEAMLEHGDYIFQLEDQLMFENVMDGLCSLMNTRGIVPFLTVTNIGNRPIISGNIRAWRELIASGSGVACYFTNLIDPIYTRDLIPDDMRGEEIRPKQLHYADITNPIEQRAHIRQSVRFIIDRGISHEFVRHRVMSFAQESTRYCNYQNAKFGSEISVIAPCYIKPDSMARAIWELLCVRAEGAYFDEMVEGLLPQEARAVLPTSLKTELIMTGTLNHWDHFFDMRARQITGPAHPQAVEVAVPLLREMQQLWPGVIC